MVERNEMKFVVGDRVVHPQHGVGYVAALEEKQFEPNISQTYYVISIPDTTLWVPVDQHTSGLRKISARSELADCRQVLQSAPLALKADRSLLPGLSDHIRMGTIVAHCEVVRDLNAFGWRKPLYGPVADFQRNLLKVLSQEWALIEEVTQIEASHEISVLLRTCRANHEC